MVKAKFNSTYNVNAAADDTEEKYKTQPSNRETQRGSSLFVKSLKSQRRSMAMKIQKS